MLTQAELKTKLHYDPLTGVFTWINKPNKKVGHLNKQNYLCIGLGIKIYKAHRLAWLYMTGAFPTHDIDHIDGIGSNNKWSNLRDAPTIINCQNRRCAQKNSSTGYLGVSYRYGKYIARLTINNITINIGRFHTAELAHDAYLKAKRIHHEGCTI